ncbi:MAG TPA: glycosyltransferase [Bacteroidales bacterium]|nr:glycosyltransferase [Bacteroidales bacterium]
MIIKNRDFVITGLQSLDSDIGSNCINIAQVFAQNNRVLYVNYPLDRFTSIREKHDPTIQKRIRVIKGTEPDLTQIGPNFWSLYPRTMLESISQIGFNPLFDFLNRVNNRRFAKQISAAIKRLNFSNILFFNDNDIYRSFYLKEFLKPSVYMYYSRDNLIAVDWWKKQGKRIEAEHMRKSDVVTANSTYLAEYALQFNPRSYYVGQGCDLTLFNKELINEIPSEITSIPRPIIGYIGVLKTLRLDIGIITHVASVRPDWSIVLIGPEDDNFRRSELHSMKNVYFLGSKEMNALPAFLKYFDVAINPQVLNEVTIGNYPRKIDEYLALGKPVVATKTKAMEIFGQHTYLAETKADYIELIERALMENSPAKEKAREQFARSHTWENNVSEIYAAYLSVMDSSNQ